jgi:hypothetical protein
MNDSSVLVGLPVYDLYHKSLPKVYQKFTKSLPKVYQKFTKSLQ